ncbi:MAG: NADH-quinone oxidoreductase subunit N [Anaerolineae bacterium]|nr:NADH-quinone oxidoreductase subunit N [Anaerolineae bacterium]
MTPLDFDVLFPVITLASWASLLLLADLFVPPGRKGLTALLAAVGLLLTLGISLSQFGRETVGFGGMVTLDGFSTFLVCLFLLAGLLGIALSYNYLQRMDIERGEYYALLLFSVVGMMLMAQASDLIVTFLALELLSFPLYVMAAMAYPKTDSEEAGIKYFLLGAFASGFVVYGIALTFGATGSTSLAEIVAVVAAGAANIPLLLVGAALILVGFSFKVAAVPFHMWTPDVYQGAPTSVTAFMAAGAKTAGFAALLRVFALGLPALALDLTQVLVVLSALSMLVGNFVAIAQTNIKRMLAYSSIAQAGYILMAFVPYANPAVRELSVAAALFYLAAYTLTSFGAWGVVIALEKANGQGLKIDDYAGLGRKQPFLAAAMTVFMLSLIGLPPTLGLVGKIYLFRAVITGGYYPLAVVGVLTSLVSAYYYLRVVVKMYMQDGDPQVTREAWLDFTIGAMAVLTVLLSLFPAPLFDWASRAVLALF